MPKLQGDFDGTAGALMFTSTFLVWPPPPAACEAGDWRALEAFLRVSFPTDYRKTDAQVNVTATASAQQATAVVCTEEQRKRLIALREKLLAGRRGEHRS